ncbi:MAG: hypothetical protein KDA79_11515, partial [Planctomycetaceae bacterium]|nr:hypothetical protein [Planctomycetaceae bacterium]
SMAMAGMAAPASAPDAAESPPAGEPPAPEPAADAQPAESKRETINIRSAGPFEFVIETNIATFEDDVRVYRPTGPDQYDSLECGLLTLQFESVPESPGTPPAAPSTAPGSGPEAAVAGGPENAAAATESDFRGVDENLTFRRMRAEGPQVVLHSQGSGMRAFMTEFVYDARSRLAELVSPGGLVRVLRSDSELQSPRIQMAWNEDNEISSMRCQGAGWLRYVDEDTGRLQLAAEWKTELRQYPENNGGLDLIELVDNATVRQPEQQMGLAAQFIRLWVDRQQAKKSAGGDPAGKDKDSQATQFHLDRMLALREVAMVSPQMEAESNRLEVWFEDVPAAPAGESSGRKPENVRTVSVTSSAPGQPAGPSAAQPKPGERAMNAQAPEDGPIRIRAELIRVRVVRQAEAEATAGAETNATAPPFRQVPAGAAQPLTVEQEARQKEEAGLPQTGNHQVAEVWTQGNVIVRQDHLDGQAPLEVTGEELHLRNNSEHGQLLTVIGQPAHIRDRSMHIEGQHVELDRAANRATVQGSGLLQFPVSSTLDGKKLATPQMFDVWWKEQMTFDGQAAKFFGGVRTVIADSRMTCQEMEVQLTRRISFIEPETGPEQADRPEIQNVVCRHGVEFESYEYAEQKLVEIRSGHFAEFSVDQTTGDTKGTGPGWIAFWRRGSGRRPGLGGASTAQANRSARAADAGWDYTRIDFSRENLGNLERRHTTFDDRVQVVYGPVEKPLEVIDVDELPKEAGSMQCSTLQMTQHPGDDKTPAWVELLGTGDTKVDGRSFHARADTISYDESKGLYMLRSLGSRKATIWRQKSTGGESSRADAQRMEFIPARNQLKLDRTTGLNGLQ